MAPNAWSDARRRNLSGLTFAVTIFVVSCGAQDTKGPPEALGAGGQTSSAEMSGVGGETSGAGGETSVINGQPSTSAGGTPTATGGTSIAVGGTSGSAGTSTPSQNGAGPSCPTYDDDFVPKVYTPVCASCHDSSSKIPNWGMYSIAGANCSLIGSRVASGAMPPPSSVSSLSAAQKSLVADWVRLGCPRTMSDLPASCFPPAGSGGSGAVPASTGMGGTGGTSAPHSGAGGTSTNPPVASAVRITRAEWDASKQTLRLEGTSSDPGAVLTADFGGRSVMLTNDAGRFRIEIGAVTGNPGTVTVRSSTGAVASANVEAN